MSLTLKGTAGMLSSHIKVHQRPVQMLNKVWIAVHGEKLGTHVIYSGIPAQHITDKAFTRAAALRVMSKRPWV